MIESIAGVILWMAIVSVGWLSVRNLAGRGAPSGDTPLGCSGWGCGGICGSDIEACPPPSTTASDADPKPERCSDALENSIREMS